jgi:hypothetical protein
LLCRSAFVRRAERFLIFTCRVIADAQCHVLFAWVDSTRIIFNQPMNYPFNSSITQQRRGGRLLRLHAKRRHNARINRAGDNFIVRQVDDERQADSAPVE